MLFRRFVENFGASMVAMGGKARLKWLYLRGLLLNDRGRNNGSEQRNPRKPPRESGPEAR